jgi:hypothetical protein
MRFDHHIFISYAHLDNEPLHEKSEGWISCFERLLRIFIGEYLGDKPKIWRDLRLESNSILAAEIEEQLLKAAILVAILSPRYVKSDWCRWEVKQFYETAKQIGLERIKNKSRIFKVEKYLVDLHDHPEEMRHQLGRRFFEHDPVTGHPREFRVEFGSEAERQFLLGVTDVAKEITALLKELEEQFRWATQSQMAAWKPPSAAPQKFAYLSETAFGLLEAQDNELPSAVPQCIYLSETTSDLQKERDNIRRELEERGYSVLPSHPLSLNIDELREQVCADLQRCELSVHLIGKRYGFIPEGADQSIVALQYEFALQCGKSSHLSRLIWMPPGLETAEERQQELLHSLQTETETETEILQVPLEELKTVIQARLTTPVSKSSQFNSASSGLCVYLDCDEQDLEEIEELYSYLGQVFDEVLLPNFENDGVISFVDDALKQSDAVIIYYGCAHDLWLKKRLLAVKKLAGYPQAKSLLVKAVYIAPPVTSRKQTYTSSDFLVIQQFEAFVPDALQPFLAQLKQGQQGVA